MLRRYLLPRIFPFFNESEVPPTGLAEKINVEKFYSAVAAFAHGNDLAHRAIIWLYPVESQIDEARQGKEWLPERRQIEEIADRLRIRIVDIAAKPEWNKFLYQTDGIHPNVEGIRVLASILVEELSKDIEHSGQTSKPASSVAFSPSETDE